MFLPFAEAANLATVYDEPFWIRLATHGAFLIGALYIAARLQADGLARRASWKYWQVACLALMAWNLTSITSAYLRTSVETGVIYDEAGSALPGEQFTVVTETVDPRTGKPLEYTYTSRGSRRDIQLEGARFAPLSDQGRAYYYLQFDVVLLLLAAVFGILGLAEERRAPVESEAENA